MNIEYFSLSQIHLLAESATPPIEPLATRLGSLGLLAGSSPLRRQQPTRARPTEESRFNLAQF